jgi:amino acid transporter
VAFNALFRRKSIDRIMADAASCEGSRTGLRKSLRVVDLTAMGIAAVIGAGIFSTIGTAAANGGPAVSLLFLFTALACAFSALCYAEFASAIPISGSAYTYAFASFGELIAWIIGWDLIMEYAIGNIAVAISWSDYFTGFLGGLGLQIPGYMTTDYLTAARGYQQAVAEMASGLPMNELSDGIRQSYQAWLEAPAVAGIRIIADIPAFSIVILITMLVYLGIYETKVAGNTMVLIKTGILLMVIGIGAFYVQPENWHPFAPNGLAGVLKGVSGVFFAYIGFDAISTTAEECRNPRKDLPRAIILTLLITTSLYVMISLVLTGMVPCSELGVGDPLSFVFHRLNMPWVSGIVAVSAVIAMAGVLLVFQVGQPRIWMSMSRDGLLPPAFSRIHPKHKTPWFSTLVAGVLVAIPSLFMNLTEVTDLTSIGTLFAFILVSGGVLILQRDTGRKRGDGKSEGFRVPYLDSRPYLMVIWLTVIVIFWFAHRHDSITQLTKMVKVSGFPMVLFMAGAVVMTWLAVSRRLSLIPVLGLLTNFYLMAQLGTTNWLRFLIWLAIGLVIYFGYSRRHSRIY